MIAFKRTRGDLGIAIVWEKPVIKAFMYNRRTEQFAKRPLCTKRVWKLWRSDKVYNQICQKAATALLERALCKLSMPYEKETRLDS